MLALAGLDEPAERGRSASWTSRPGIASHHWDRVACRDTQKTYNLRRRRRAAGARPDASTSPPGPTAARIPAPAVAEVVVAQPSFLQGLADLLVDDELAGLARLAALARRAQRPRPTCPSAFVDANFEFYGRTLSGTDELRPRWKRGVGFVEGAMGEAVGKIYVRTEFPPAAKERMSRADRQPHRGLPREHQHAAVDERGHQGAGAREARVRSPRRSATPTSSRTTRRSRPTPTDLLGNARRALAVAMDRELAKIGSPIDRDEWYMTPQTVNAYYNPTMNEIVFPAAILQPPFFHPDADDAVNYGAIGAVIGHEIGHGFDDQGSQYDGTGALNNWWTDDDRAAFDAPHRGAHRPVRRPLTRGRRRPARSTARSRSARTSATSAGSASPTRRFGSPSTAPSQQPIDGLTPDQRFFFSWAQAWQAKVRPAETVRRLTIDPHSPPEFRCNQVVRNIDAFYDAFDVTPDDGALARPRRSASRSGDRAGFGRSAAISSGVTTSRGDRPSPATHRHGLSRSRRSSAGSATAPASPSAHCSSRTSPGPPAGPAWPSSCSRSAPRPSPCRSPRWPRVRPAPGAHARLAARRPRRSHLRARVGVSIRSRSCCSGSLLFGSGTAANLQSRFAAVDRADPSQVGRALSLVVWSTTIGAVIGPNLTGPGATVATPVGVPDLAGPMLFSVAGVRPGRGDDVRVPAARPARALGGRASARPRHPRSAAARARHDAGRRSTPSPRPTP